MAFLGFCILLLMLINAQGFNLPHGLKTSHQRMASSSSATSLEAYAAGAQNLDWVNLGFEFRQTRSHIKVVYKGRRGVPPSWWASPTSKRTSPPLRCTTARPPRGPQGHDPPGRQRQDLPGGREREAHQPVGRAHPHARVPRGALRGALQGGGAGQPGLRAPVRHGRLAVPAAAALRLGPARGAAARGRDGPPAAAARRRRPPPGDAGGGLLPRRPPAHHGRGHRRLRPRGAPRRRRVQGGRELRRRHAPQHHGQEGGLPDRAVPGRQDQPVRGGVLHLELPGGHRRRPLPHAGLAHHPQEHHQQEPHADSRGRGPGG
ncbi:unnamed protein product [Heterosigma akashiwo]